MKLDRVQIINFRSIEDITLSFSKMKCRVLVGINESGKSNILKALRLLSDEYNSTKEDIREPLPGENAIDESEVRFIFSLTDKECSEISGKLSEKVLFKKDEKIIQKKGVDLTFCDFCKNRREVLYEANIIEGKKSYKFWAINNSYSVNSNWKKVSEQCPADFVLDVGKEQKPLQGYKFVNTKEYDQIPAEHLEDLKPEDLNSFVGGEATKYAKEHTPKVIFWSYDENHLLPPQIKIDEFIANPDICRPLKNMFNLAGISDIPKSINDAKAKNRNAFHNLLDGVAKKTTAYFRNVWKEYKSIEFSLEPDGENIIPTIKEENRFNFQQRSDGFKRFVSFLLLISANVKTDVISDNLLLIDEPDISLHPSGAKYLRDELIKISEKNYVAYSTHSIFMIDGSQITRHVIVSKKKEKTQIEDATEHNIVKEEVIYNAMGFSYFESLKVKNIVFEGWKDEVLFKTAMKSLPNNYKNLKNTYKDIGICNSRGVKGVKAVSSLLKLANREIVIVSDNDGPAKDHKKQFIEDHCHGKWLMYSDVDSDLNVITGEDFVKNDLFIKAIKKIKKDRSLQVDISEQDFINKNKIAVIKKWLNDNSLEDKEKADLLDEIKNYVFENLKITDIEDNYFEFISKLSSHI